MKKIYFARPIHLYNSPQDVRDIKTLQDLGFEVIDPNTKENDTAYKLEGMVVFLRLIQQCDGVAFRSFPDGKISTGVFAEIREAIETDKMVIELPALISTRYLSVNDTREYLKLVGKR